MGRGTGRAEEMVEQGRMRVRSRSLADTRGSMRAHSFSCPVFCRHDCLGRHLGVDTRPTLTPAFSLLSPLNPPNPPCPVPRPPPTEPAVGHTGPALLPPGADQRLPRPGQRGAAPAAAPAGGLVQYVLQRSCIMRWLSQHVAPCADLSPPVVLRRRRPGMGAAAVPREPALHFEPVPDAGGPGARRPEPEHVPCQLRPVRHARRTDNLTARHRVPGVASLTVSPSPDPTCSARHTDRPEPPAVLQRRPPVLCRLGHPLPRAPAGRAHPDL